VITTYKEITRKAAQRNKAGYPYWCDHAELCFIGPVRFTSKGNENLYFNFGKNMKLRGYIKK